MKRVLFSLILLLFLSNLNAQRIYTGTEFRLYGGNFIFTDYEWLSDSPLNHLPYRIDKKVQFHLNNLKGRDELGYVLSYAWYGGFHYKRFFFEIFSQFWSNQPYTITATKPVFSDGTTEYNGTTWVNGGNHFFDVKYNFSGRKNIRATVNAGFGYLTPYNVNVTTESHQGNFIKYVKKFNEMARIGLELYFNSFASVQLRYTHHLAPVFREINTGFLELTWRTSAYKGSNRKKEIIFINE